MGIDAPRRLPILAIGNVFSRPTCQDASRPVSGQGLMIMFAAIIVGAHLVLAVADRPPVMNFEQACRDETARNVRTGDKFETCVADEKRARDQVTAEWSLFDAGGRARCAREATSGQSASYLELLVCLELDQADRDVRRQDITLGTTTTEPDRPARAREEATDPNRGRLAPNQPAPAQLAPSQSAPSQSAPSQAAPVAPPSRPAAPGSAQPPPARSAAAAPAAPPQAAPVPASPPPPAAEAQPPSQGELLRQSVCRSPWGYVLPGC